MNTDNLTPAQKQFIEIKQKNPDCIIFFRMGDFYETFYDDAKICSKVLDIVLTSKNKNSENPIPMAGVPYHSYEKYLSKLVKTGHKVAIVEQIGEVKPGQLVKREVASIVSPGTFIDEKEVEKYNYISSIVYGSFGNISDNYLYHISWGDFSVGEYWTKSFLTFEDALKFLVKICPKEIVIDLNFSQKEELQTYISNFSKSFFSIYDVPFDADFFLKNILQVQTLASFGKALELGRKNSLALLLNYLKETQKTSLKNISSVSFWGEEDKIILDEITLKNLEIFQSSYESLKKYSLIGILDSANTTMGSRLLRSVLMSPLKDLNQINRRLDNIGYYFDDLELTKKIIGILKNIGDIPRIISNLIYKKNSPFVWARLKNILRNIFINYSILDGKFDIKKIDLENINGFFIQELKRLGLGDEKLNQIKSFYYKLEEILKDENFAEDIDFIRDGYSKEVDDLRKIAYHSDELLLQYQQELTERLGIQNIKIKYITNQGYFIEVSKKDSDKLESMVQKNDGKLDFFRRQTLKTGERYVTTYLENIQTQILSSKTNLQKLEKEILELLKQEVETLSKIFFDFSSIISWLDLFISLAELSKQKMWIKPTLNNDDKIEIIGGRHPVIEEYLPMDEKFVPNNFIIGKFDSDNSNIHIITGPNMGGKSTFLRQNALIVLMAHCGIWVPATKASIGIVDGIFARVGSGDVIAKNQSTFMTEMIEVSNILHNATSKSFVVLDELGRGTSTYDGMALAKAIIIYIAEKIKAKTIFATHYHELIKLEGQIPGVINYCVGVYENDKDVVFLKKILRGGADKSYGIDVAKLAGLPNDIIIKAKEYLKNLENSASSKKTIADPLFVVKEESIYKDKYENITNKLKNIDINNMSIMQIVALLEDLKNNNL